MNYQYTTTLVKISGKRVPAIKFRSLFWNYTDLSCFPIRILLCALKKRKLWSRVSFRRQPCGRCKIPNLWRAVTWHNRVPETGMYCGPHLHIITQLWIFGALTPNVLQQLHRVPSLNVVLPPIKKISAFYESQVSPQCSPQPDTGRYLQADNIHV